MRLEPAHDLFSFAGWLVRHFDGVIQTFVGMMVSLWCKYFDRLDIAAQFVGDDDPGFAKLGNRPEQPTDPQRQLCSTQSDGKPRPRRQ